MTTTTTTRTTVRRRRTPAHAAHAHTPAHPHTPHTPAPAHPRTLREYLAGPPRRTQRQLARQLRIHQSMVSMLVSGLRRPGGALALRLQAITGVPLERLLRGAR